MVFVSVIVIVVCFSETAIAHSSLPLNKALQLGHSKRKKLVKELWAQALAHELRMRGSAKPHLARPPPSPLDCLRPMWLALRRNLKGLSAHPRGKTSCTYSSSSSRTLDHRLRQARHRAEQHRKVAVLNGDPV